MSKNRERVPLTNMTDASMWYYVRPISPRHDLSDKVRPHHLSPPSFAGQSPCCLSLRSIPLTTYIESQENATMRVPSMLLMPFVALFGLVSARSATGDRVLVVLESAATKDDYSQFWDSLQRTQIPYKCDDILTTK